MHIQVEKKAEKGKNEKREREKKISGEKWYFVKFNKLKELFKFFGFTRIRLTLQTCPIHGPKL